MKASLTRLLIRLYPRAWRERYQQEYELFLQESKGRYDLLDVLRSALKERILPTTGGNMDQPVYTVMTITRKPSAFVPLAMSGSALLILLGALLYSHIVKDIGPPDRDEGAIAHLWQLLMTIQLPIIFFFAVKWLRRAPRQTLGVLALQATAWLLSCTPVYLLHL